MKQRLWGTLVVALVAVACVVRPATAQSEVFSGTGYSEQGSRFDLVIVKTGNRLKFDLTAQSATTSMAGTPRCDSVDLHPDGTFLTHCGKFQTQDPGRYRLEGNLTTARIDTVFRFGRAEFKLARGPLATSKAR